MANNKLTYAGIIDTGEHVEVDDYDYCEDLGVWQIGDTYYIVDDRHKSVEAVLDKWDDISPEMWLDKHMWAAAEYAFEKSMEN